MVKRANRNNNNHVERVENYPKNFLFPLPPRLGVDHVVILKQTLT